MKNANLERVCCLATRRRWNLLGPLQGYLLCCSPRREWYQLAAPALFAPGASHIPGLHIPWIDGVSVIFPLPGIFVFDFLPFSLNRKSRWCLICFSSLFFRSTVFCLPLRYVPVTLGCLPRRTVVVMSRCDQSSRSVLR